MREMLKLAIEDEEFGPEIRKERISTPEERSQEAVIQLIRRSMERAGEWEGEGKKAKKNRALLEVAMDDASKMLNLRMQWLTRDQRKFLGDWPGEEGETFIVHAEAVWISRFITQEYRRDLQRFKIAVIMQEEVPPVNRRGRLGTAMKLPGKMTFLSQLDAVITLGWLDWRQLSDTDRQRLVHHELEHLEVERDSGERLVLRTHDFEDFVTVARLYGIRSESQRFSTDSMAPHLEEFAAQLELL